MKSSTLPSSTWNLRFIAFLFSAMAVGGSLFFSEIMELAPCTLCWYQRIALFPLALILFISLVKDDPGVAPYALSLTVGGFFISVYHNLLKWGVLPESLSPCQTGVSCKTEYLNLFGFLSIPLMALLLFSLLLLLMILIQKKVNK